MGIKTYLRNTKKMIISTSFVHSNDAFSKKGLIRKPMVSTKNIRARVSSLPCLQLKNKKQKTENIGFNRLGYNKQKSPIAVRKRVMARKFIFWVRLFGISKYFFTFSKFFNEYAANLFKFCRYSVKLIKETSKIRNLIKVFHRPAFIQEFLKITHKINRIFPPRVCNYTRISVFNNIYAVSFRFTSILRQFMRRYLKFHKGVEFHIPKLDSKFIFKIFGIQNFKYRGAVLKKFIFNYQSSYIKNYFVTSKILINYCNRSFFNQKKIQYPNYLMLIKPFKYSIFNFIDHWPVNRSKNNHGIRATLVRISFFKLRLRNPSSFGLNYRNKHYNLIF